VPWLAAIEATDARGYPILGHSGFGGRGRGFVPGGVYAPILAARGRGRRARRRTSDLVTRPSRRSSRPVPGGPGRSHRAPRPGGSGTYTHRPRSACAHPSRPDKQPRRTRFGHLPSHKVRKCMRCEGGEGCFAVREIACVQRLTWIRNSVELVCPIGDGRGCFLLVKGSRWFRGVLIKEEVVPSGRDGAGAGRSGSGSGEPAEGGAGAPAAAGPGPAGTGAAHRRGGGRRRARLGGADRGRARGAVRGGRGRGRGRAADG